MRNRLIVAALALCVPLLMAELIAQTVTRLGWMPIPRPMTTLLPPGTEDWRLAHITADRHREADPVLLWRPVDRAPYNAQRMKGPVAALPKPPGVFRIMVYGDSNADGPSSGSWPELLGDRLANRTSHSGETIEVLNAGVAGYSSYQGVLRLAAQAPVFQPDLVLVAFGWNDAADALGRPDRLYEPPPPWLADLRRGLLRLRSYRMLRSLTSSTADPADIGTRVPLTDFAANLERFAGISEANGATLVLMTRATRDAPAELAKRTPSWRARVPLYNDAVRQFAATHQIRLIDTNLHFLEIPGSEVDFVDESHFSTTGRARMAKWVADSLIRQSLLEAAAEPGRGL